MSIIMNIGKLTAKRLVIIFSFSERANSEIEKQRHDGWFNNLAHPSWGSVGKSNYIIYLSR